MDEFEALLETAAARLRAAESGNREGVLDPVAPAIAEKLLAATVPAGHDAVDVALIAGMLLFAHGNALPPGEARTAALGAARSVLAEVSRHSEGMAPAVRAAIAAAVDLDDVGNVRTGKHMMEIAIKTGDANALAHAISGYRTTLQQDGGGTHPDRLEAMSNLSTALRMRYERTRRLADLAEAFDWAERAVEASDPGSPARPNLLTTLAVCLGLLAVLTRDVANGPTRDRMILE